MAEQNTQALKLLDDIVAKLDASIAAKTGEPGEASAGSPLPDAIDREIAAQPLQTAVARIRESDAVGQFRQELETESLTAATVTAFLQVLQRVLPLLLGS